MSGKPLAESNPEAPVLSMDDDVPSGAAVPADHGALPPWKPADLPEPLPFSFLNTLRTIGPGAILLAGAIGGGEWIVGPMMAVKHGPSILWIATVSILLQSLFNLEAVRYTLYTGEPILTGVMRLSPGPKLWAPFYLVMGAAQLATPAIAAGCAVVLFAAFTGRSPAELDTGWLRGIGMVLILASAALLMSGRSIEHVLERLSWAMIAFIFVFLMAVNVWCVPAANWGTTLRGFFVVRPLPADINLPLLGLFAATAGSGGLGNLAISNWFRDKGFGMGSRVGSISGALSETTTTLAPVGFAAPVTPGNTRRWKSWWRYALLDQQALWATGCFLGMFLNVNLAMAIVPDNFAQTDGDVGTFQARYLADTFWSGLWLLALVNGFWILFSTHLGNTDCLVRTATDILWAASPRVQRYPASRIYAGLLSVLTIWALFAIHLGSVLELFKVLGILASPIMAIAAIQILRVNTRFLPAEFRPPWWRRLALVCCVFAYGGISIALLLNMFKEQKPPTEKPRPAAAQKA